MPTRPARAPLSAWPTSGRPKRYQLKPRAASAPVAPASVVFTKICGTFWENPRLLPPLNPYHPNHKSKTPRVARGMFCPWMGRALSEKRPMRGPIIITAAKATHPPTEWTTVDPAKSIKPRFFNHPVACPVANPPHIQ